MGSRNHEIVPVPLITQIAGLRSGSGVHRCISNLAKANLISKIKNAKYDGYRLTYGGLDYLALNSHRKGNCIYSVGNQIGVGKESDIFVVASPSGRQRVLKIHRLGRISFRTVKSNRDYLRNRSSGSWMYMSRLAALKEHAFMKALWDHGFPVPEPISHNRHTVVMALVDGFPLRQISSVPDPAKLYAEIMSLIVRLAQFGLIHGDFNEFNIMVEEQVIETPQSPTNITQEEQEGLSPAVKLNPVIIDFPQMVSMSHSNAEYYFDRDVACIKRFFSRRFKFTSDDQGPFFADALRELASVERTKRLDVEVEASGFSKKMAKELEAYMKDVGVDGDGADAAPGAPPSATLDGDTGCDEDGEESESEDPDEQAQARYSAEMHRPLSPRLWPVVSPVDVMTPLNIQDEQFAHQTSLEDSMASNKPDKAKEQAGWAI